MALDITCFDEVIGLADCECPCLTETAPAGYSDNTSGLYIADLIPLNMATGADKCSDPDNPWNVLAWARTQGQNQLVKDLQAEMMKRNKFVRAPYKGMIGEKSSRETASLSKTYAGIRISAPQIRGAKMRITSIGGVFTASGSVSVRIYDRFNNTVGSAAVITTIANAHASTACDIELPLHIDGATNPEYFAVFTANQSNLPRNTRAWCPTCTKSPVPPFSLTAPYYIRNGSPWIGTQGWANWLMVGAWEGDNLTDFDIHADDATTGSGMNGLTISCEITCDPLTSICDDGLDFTDPVALSVAHAFRYIAAIHAAERIIRNPAPFRNAAVTAQILAEDIKQWYLDYRTNLEYAAYHANANGSGCLICKPKFSMGIESKIP